MTTMFSDREWHGVACASAEALAALQDIAPITLPESLLYLLAFSNGGEGPLPVQPLWFILYPAEEIAGIEANGDFKEFFPGFFVFGGNGGGEAIALDLRSGGGQLPVVSFDMANINLAESVWALAPSFDEFVELIGRE